MNVAISTPPIPPYVPYRTFRNFLELDDVALCSLCNLIQQEFYAIHFQKLHEECQMAFL